MIRRGTRFMLQNAYNDVVRPSGGDRLDVLRQARESRQGGDVPDSNARRAFVIDLDYRHAAFPLDGVEMFEESPGPPEVVQEPYKAPKAAQKGFIRTFSESDVVLCPRCGDELAIGKDDTKQQVWVVKQCGHVYCGACAATRTAPKPVRKDKKKPPPSAATAFKSCVVDECNTKVTGKTTMFPIYL